MGGKPQREENKILIVTTTGLGKKEGISTIILDYFSRFDKDKLILILLHQAHITMIWWLNFKTLV